MSTPVVAAGAAALGFYVWVRQWQQCGSASVVDLPLLPETHARTEAPPTTWSETLYLFKEAFRYMYLETFGRWHAIDLFFGLAYLSRRATSEYPAADIAAAGQAISGQQLSAVEAQRLLQELRDVRRYMLYCQGLRHHRPEQQKKHWHDLVGLGDADIIKHSPAAGLLRPAYVVLRDRSICSIILCVRGTHSRSDMFTSLTGTVKPHHAVTANGVVLGYSHLGMLAAARWLMGSIKETLITALQQNPGYTLKIIGHSMGGGTAAMLTMMLRDKVPELSAATAWAIACPACMTLQLARSCAPYVTTLVHGTDIVPTFSSGAIDKLRQEVTQSSWFVEFQSDIRQRLAANFSSSLRGLRQGAAGTAQWTQRNIIRTAATSLSSCYSRAPRSCYYRAARKMTAASTSSTSTPATASTTAAAVDEGQPSTGAAGSSSSSRAPFSSTSRRLPGRAKVSSTGADGRPGIADVDATLSSHNGNALDDDASVEEAAAAGEEGVPLVPRGPTAFWLGRFGLKNSSRQHAASTYGMGSTRDSNAAEASAVTEAALVERALQACLSAADAGQLGTFADISSSGLQGGDASAHVHAAAAVANGSVHQRVPTTAAAAAAAGPFQASGSGSRGTAAGNLLKGVSRVVLGKRPAAPSKKDDDDDASPPSIPMESAAAAVGDRSHLPVSTVAVDPAAASSSSRSLPQSLRRRGWGWEGVLAGVGQGWVTDESGNISNGIAAGGRSVVQYIGQTVGHTGKVVLETTGQLLKGRVMFQNCAAPAGAAAQTAAAAAVAAGHGPRQRKQRCKRQGSEVNGVMTAPSSSSDLMRMDRYAGDEPGPFAAAEASRLSRSHAANHHQAVSSDSDSSGSSLHSDDDGTLDGDSESDPDLFDEQAAFHDSNEGFDPLNQSAMKASISALMAAASTDVEGEGMYLQAHREEAVAAERLLRETGANIGASSGTNLYKQQQQQQTQGAGASGAEANTGHGESDRLEGPGSDAQQQQEPAVDYHVDKATERKARRQMYPAGRILHLMPATVAAAAAANQAGSSNTGSQHPQDMCFSEEQQQLLQLDRSLPPLNAVTGSVGLGDEYVLLEVENVEVYGRMRLCPAMVRDHFIPSYLRALDSVLGQLEQQLAGQPAKTEMPDQYMGEELLAQ